MKHENMHKLHPHTPRTPRKSCKMNTSMECLR